MSHEWPGPDLTFRDAGTGEIIWRKEVNTGDVERGVAGDILAQYKGAECWATEDYKVYNCKGEPVQIDPKTKSFLIYWDGDLQRENAK